MLKGPLFKILMVLLCWFLALELCSRWIISNPWFYEHYVKRVSDAGMRLEFTRPKPKEKDDDGHHLYTIFSPTRGWALRPKLKDLKIFDGKFMNTNSRGIRGSEEYSYDKVPGKTRVLILGDSFTFGEEVSDTETYPYLLQQMLPQTQIINFGVSAYGQDQMLIYLQEEGLKYHPDIIILGYASWDNARNLHEIMYRPKPRFQWVGGRLWLVRSQVRHRSWYLHHEFYRSKFCDLLDILRFDILRKTGKYERQAQDITDHILDQIVSISREHGAKIIFAPISTDFILPHEPDAIESQVNRFYATWESKGVLCPRLGPLTIPMADGNVFLRGKHYKPRVYQKIAEGLRDFLLSRHLVGEETPS